MESVADYFGSLVFNDDVMRERLPKDVYKALRRTVDEGKDLDINIANAVANAMKNWAIEKGCTHYTHWFQPMTGITAEKHEAFIAPAAGGKVLLEFSGKELIKGEPDASSFPSGGLRATFEARGYTAWDPTSYAFIKDETLCIPTAFCSYSGESLDKKTPLLRSMEAISAEALKILRLFGTDARRVITTVGPEQEYFLIDKKDYDRRKDLIYTGRTLLGARSPKGQEMEDHYFGALRTRVSEYMQDLDRELWKLGIYAKTSHNEVAPCQHELAPIFTTTNIAVDNNQLTMEIMKKVAERHGFACLLHEKPFAGVNGSGKHNNWSLCTDKGTNILEPGDSPKSMFLGDELTEILESIAEGRKTSGKAREELKLGVHVLPAIPKDTSDRNRTSPFAFTGNKFEFRMLGSSFSVAEPNTVLNTIVAKELREFHQILSSATDFTAAVNDLVRDTYISHRRIVFNGNNYSKEWVEEAERRGLLNLASAPDAYDAMLAPKNIEVFSEFGIYSSIELHSRSEILNEEYSKTIHIEALTMIDMINRQVMPAVIGYSARIASSIAAKRAALPEMNLDAETDRLAEIGALENDLHHAVKELEKAVAIASGYSGSPLAHYYRNTVLPLMDEVRTHCDALELIVGQKDWPYPTYGEMLFYV